MSGPTHSERTPAPRTPPPAAEPTGDVWQELTAAWRTTDRLFDIVPAAHLAERPIPLRHPLLFYAGHLPAFASNMLLTGLLGRRPAHARFDRLFAFGIDPDDDAPDAGDEPAIEWPPLEEVLRYRDIVRRAVLGARDDVEARRGRDRMADRDRMVHLVLEHELMHHETLLYLLQELALDKKRAPAGTVVTPAGEPARSGAPIRIPAGRVTLGSDFDAVDFGWDNEFAAHAVDVDEFVLMSAPVTIGEYARFVAAGGYREPRWWDDASWRWRERRDVRAPKDWRSSGDSWVVRSMFAEHEIDAVAGWPVNVSWAEATAYARWRGCRLPTAAELHRAAYTAPAGRSAPRRAGRGDLDLQRLSPRPVGASPETDSAWRAMDLHDSGWEWTSTPFAPYPGFDAYVDTYAGYSADFFDGVHYEVFGGSHVTPRRLRRRGFRNWYRYNYRYAFTNLRLASDA